MLGKVYTLSEGQESSPFQFLHPVGGTAGMSIPGLGISIGGGWTGVTLLAVLLVAVEMVGVEAGLASPTSPNISYSFEPVPPLNKVKSLINEL